MNDNIIAEALAMAGDKIATALDKGLDSIAEQIANVSSSLDNINDNGSLSEVATELGSMSKALDHLSSINVDLSGSVDTS